MCAIVGSLGANGRDEFSQTNCLVRRGPDGRYVDKAFHYSLEMYRLIFKGTLKEEIPFICNCKESSWSLIFNGEAYNFKLLQKNLQELGHTFNNLDSDGEVLAHLFAEYGDSAIPMINGMFALVAINKSKNKAIIARDKYGKKPLSYKFENNVLYFSSRLDSLLPDDSKARGINQDFLIDYLNLGYGFDESSPIVGIENLKSGHFIDFDFEKAPESIREKLWDHEYPYLDGEKYSQNKLRHVLLEAVNIRVQNNVDKTALFLSGGIDSAIIAAILKKELGHDCAPFTFAPHDYEFSELEGAKLVCDNLGMELNVVTQDPTRNDFTSMVAAMDQPFSDISIMPMHLVAARMAASSHRYALSGDGADEFFGGYTRYLPTKALIKTALPNNFQDKVSFFVGKREHLSRYFIDLLIGNQVSGGYLAAITNISRNDMKRILSSDMHDAYKNRNLNVKNKLQDILEVSTNDVAAFMTFDQKNYLPGHILRKLDSSCMYHSIEVRSPFLDDNVIEYALHSFKDEYVESDVTKILLREFASTYFGKDFAFRKKTGFSFDLVQYLKKDLRDDISLIPRRIEIMGFTKILNIGEIKNLINKTEWSKPDSRIIWSLLVLLEWCYQRDLSVS